MQYCVVQVGDVYVGFIGIVVVYVGGVVVDGQQDQVFVVGLVQYQCVVVIDDWYCFVNDLVFGVIGGDGGIVEWIKGCCIGQGGGNVIVVIIVVVSIGIIFVIVVIVVIFCCCQQIQVVSNYWLGDVVFVVVGIGWGIGQFLQCQ